MKKRKLTQGLQCITKYLKITNDSESIEDRVPAAETLNKDTLKVHDTEEITLETVPVDVSSDSEDSVNTDMHHWHGGEFPQRGRLNQNYYNAREERNMQNRGGFHGELPPHDRRQSGYGSNDSRHHQQYQPGQGNSRYHYDNHGGYGRPPHGNRYRDTHQSDDRQRYTGQSQHEMSRSHSYDYSQKGYDSRRGYDKRSYDNFKYPGKSKAEGDNHSMKQAFDKTQTDKTKENASGNKKPDDITKKPDNNADTSPQGGFNVYKSDAYFSAGGAPEVVRDSKVSTPIRNVKKQSPRNNRISPRISPVRRQESAPSNLVTIPLIMEVSTKQSPPNNLVNIPLVGSVNGPLDACSASNMIPVQHLDDTPSNLVSIPIKEKEEENMTTSSNLVSIPLPGSTKVDNIGEKTSSPFTLPIANARALSSYNNVVSVPVQDMEVANVSPLFHTCPVDKTVQITERVDPQDKMDVTSNLGKEIETASVSSPINKPVSESQNNDDNDKSIKDEDNDLDSPKLKLDVIITDKMDFSTIKRALNEVRTKELGRTRKSSASDGSHTVTSPSHKTSGQETLEILSPKLSDQTRQRSAFNIMTLQNPQDSTINKPSGPELQPDLINTSPNSAFLPLGRKGSQSGEQKTPKLTSSGFRHLSHDGQSGQDKEGTNSRFSLSNVLSTPSKKLSESTEKRTVKHGPQDHTLCKTARTPSESDTGSSVSCNTASKFEASLKSASSYAEWKKIKAKQEQALQKEKEKNRSCLEMANTPEEYRKLLKLQGKKSREKDKPSSQSDTHLADPPGDSRGDQDVDMDHPNIIHNSKNAFTAIPDHDSGSEEDIDLEESDDDLEAPSFLFSLEEASNRPIPGTPTKLTACYESPGPCSPAPEPDLTDITKSALLSSKFSLDQLVSERYDKSEDQREYEEMHAKLEEGLKKGGFVKDTLESSEPLEEDILPEHEKHLQKFQILESEISEIHPGEVIFQPLLFQHLFDGSISPQTCGFKPGASYIDKYLSTLQPKYYSLLLTSNILKNTLENVSCLESVLSWVFLLMSIDSNQLVSQGCEKVLAEHLNREVHFRESPQTWAPSIQDILAVFCNYGCEVKTLLPDHVTTPSKEYSSSLIHQEQEGVNPLAGHYSLRNLHLVLNILAQALHARPRYCNKELTELLVIMCRVAVDRSHNSEILPHEFQVCFRGILRSFTSDYWDENCNDLCHTVFKITSHHHNRLYLAQLFPEDKRGGYLQKRLAYLCLQDMFNVGRDIDIKNYRIKCLHVFLPCLHNLVYDDVYKLSSAISYLDIAVGNSTIKLVDKEDLQYLCDQLKKISGDVKDSVRMLDRSWVKDMMVRVCSKWTLYLLSVGSKQKSMFAYAKKKTSVEIKTVQASQGGESSQSDEDECKYSSIGNDNQTRRIDYQSMDSVEDNSNLSESRTPLCDNSTGQDTESNTTVTIKTEKPDVIPLIDCGSPMEVDLTEDDLPDLLDHS